MMEPIALTRYSPDALGAVRTAVRLPLLKPKRARAGKEDSPGSPRTAFLGPDLLAGDATSRHSAGVQQLGRFPSEADLKLGQATAPDDEYTP
jgi:hypothetical protein